MFLRNKTNRRNVIKTGLASVTAAAVSFQESQAAVRPKAKGETKVVYIGGDGLHSGFTQEGALRGVYRNTGWRLLFTRDCNYVTPELISDADLLIATRWGGGGGEGWLPEPIIEGNRPGDNFMTKELEEAVIDNIKNRGMGLMSLHCTVANDQNKKFIEFMGIRWMMHGPVQTVRMHNFNQNHPISKGIEEFDLPLDENFGVELINKNAVPLYESTGHIDHRHDIAGWCIEQGKGRIVGLPAGHTYTSWRHPIYQKLYLRGAYWAMKKEIPES